MKLRLFIFLIAISSILAAAAYAMDEENAAIAVGERTASDEESLCPNVKGFVFNDLNNDGEKACCEPGIPNVLVSNGREVVKTNHKGKYVLPAYDEMVVFVTKPAGWQVPLNENNVPQFSYIHQPNGSPPEIQEFHGIDPTGPMPHFVNFPMTKVNKKNKFKAIVMGDTQVYTDQEIGYLRDTVVKDLAGNDAAFAIAMGDNMGDDLSLYPRYFTVMKEMGVPFYLVPGNHDLNFDSPDDAHSFDTFKREFGPTYYSFDYGKVHFVVLDSVIYPSWIYPDSYHGQIDDIQMEWLANDLSFVPKNKLIVLNMHIPVVSYQDRMSDKHQVGNREDLYDLLDEFDNVVTLGGHSHTLEHFLPGEEEDGWGQPTPINQIIVGAACGSWWTGDHDDTGVPMAYQRCGTPRGYMIFKFKGNKYNDKYFATSRSTKDQISVSFLTEAFEQWIADVKDGLATLNDLPDPGTLTLSQLYTTKLVANVWNGSDASEVTFQFDDEQPIPAVREKEVLDPYALRLQAYVLRFAIGAWIWGSFFEPGVPGPLDEWLWTMSSTHIWTCDMPLNLTIGSHKVTVKTKDVKGNKHQETMEFEVVDG